MSEFDFELRLCGAIESHGYPGSEPTLHSDPIVARQLGGSVNDPGRRVVDAVLVEPGAQFPERAAITSESIPRLAIEAAVPTGRAVSRREAFADLDVSPERQRAVIEAAVEVGFFERDRREGRTMVRQVATYPDWFHRLVAIENKPDLGEPGDLARQLQFDVALSLFDAVVLATESYVTRGHLNRLPDSVGAWRLHGGEIDVIRDPTLLDSSGGGTEIAGWGAGHTDVVPVGGAAKRRTRRKIAERAYGKGFRPDRFPACAHTSPVERNGAGGLPHCAVFDRLVAPGRDCGPACSHHEPAPPPEVDPDRHRAENSRWVADPDGRARTQSDLERFDGA